jgi:hypothetical protein
MDKVVPWAELLAVIEPHYPKPGRRGRQPMVLSTMLRLYFMQPWYALSDPAMKDALHEIEPMRLPDSNSLMMPCPTRRRFSSSVTGWTNTG